MASSLGSACRCITFLSDFGMRDTYVAQMKGVALGINPDVHLVDLTHEIPPQDVLLATFLWSDALDAFPENTIHVGIVDPGVGSDRNLIAAEIGPFRVVCPDNGLISVLLQRESVRRVVKLDHLSLWRRTVSSTFHGRDILTPVAAAWSRGVDLSELGTVYSEPLVTLPLATPTFSQSSITGRIIDVDRFGNLITNIAASLLPEDRNSLRFEAGPCQVHELSRCYADAPVGEPLALIGSCGRLEFAIRDGNAAEEFQLSRGRRVVVRW
ncbi:S-adenosyl-l-methionine hydroxide adenosyltransferase family protein [Schlesneria sp. DSM 10557]|uniref:SAM hydrolase/SAM-dependent halogenase family protein n=1 Tax=Schlesneria sp. DSM 10557 TaxID=3044399 RepID=UPI0035C86B00